MGVKKSLGKKAKLPKRLGGVKLPKDMRKTGSRLMAVANSPVGRELLATGLGLAAAAVTAAMERERGQKRDGAAPEKATAKAGGQDPHDIGVQLGHLAEAALAGLFRPKRG